MTELVSPTPYEVLGGHAWRALPTDVRLLHAPGRACGELEVLRGTHVVARWIGAVLGLPRAGRNVPVSVAVSREGTRLVWRRWFGETDLVTDQYAHHGLLIERFGAIELRFQLQLGSMGIEFLQRRVALTWGPVRLPLPSRVAPVAHGLVTQVQGGVAIRVSVRMPLIGELLRYQGVMRVEGRAP